MPPPDVQSSKWIEGLGPQQPLSQAARRVLDERLGTVLRLLPIAARGRIEPVRAVHQLRVSTRRAMAALEMFHDLLPVKRGRRIRKQLKAIRRAAGDARDLDVLLTRWTTQAGPTPDEPWRLLIDEATRRRRAAQKPLRAMRKQAKQAGLKPKMRWLISRTGWPRSAGNEPSFAEAGRQRVAPAIEALAAAEPLDVEDLAGWHAMRIEGKRLRYAMEIFAQGFDASFREELYPQVEELQEQLGRINDHVTARDLLESWRSAPLAPEARARIDELIEAEVRQLAEARASFHAWWTPAVRDVLFANLRDSVAEETKSDSSSTSCPG